MATLRTAAQQALEALSAILTHMGMDEDDWNKPTFDQCRSAETALHAALAEPEPPPEAQTEAEKIAYCAGWWDALAKARKAEPVKEPVASTLTKAQANAILDMALDLEKTGRIVSLSEGQERTDFVARNRNIECALRDYLRNLTE